MEAWADVETGECGYGARAMARCEDGQHVSFELSSGCPKICSLGKVLRHADPVDSYMEIAPGTRSRLYAICSEVLTGCCSGCLVPVAMFRAMQVAAGLSLSGDVTIRVRKENP